MDKTKVTKDLENKRLTIERTFDAPREKLWRAFSDKDMFTQWWGPEGWETTVKEFNFTPGGRNHYCMKCVDKNQGEWYGQESWGLMAYETIDEPNSFTYKDYFSDAEGNMTRSDELPAVTATNEFVEENGKTTMISICQGETAEDIEKLVAMGMIEGFSSSADKLERLVTT